MFKFITFSLREIRCFSKRSNSADQGSCPHFANKAAIHLLGLSPSFFIKASLNHFNQIIPWYYQSTTNQLLGSLISYGFLPDIINPLLDCSLERFIQSNITNLMN